MKCIKMIHLEKILSRDPMVTREYQQVNWHIHATVLIKKPKNITNTRISIHDDKKYDVTCFRDEYLIIEKNDEFLVYM